MGNLITRFIQPVGTDVDVSWYWENTTPCKDGWPPHNGKWAHIARVRVASSDTVGDHTLGGSLDDYRDYPHKPAGCERCGAPIDPKASMSMGWHRRYNTVSGKPEPGDIFFLERHKPGEWCYAGWTNCDGMHLHAICPNGQHWDIDSRASNCTLKDETTHRCWVRHGDPRKGELVHVDKAGHTCAAGAGSIVAGDFHGWLHSGFFTAC